jgi:hypothetical protein
MSVWDNPVFQWNYRKYRIKKIWPLWVLFIIGLMVTVVCNIALKRVFWGQYYDFGSMMFISVFIPGMISSVFFTSLSYGRSPFLLILQLKRDIGSGAEDKLLMSTPLTSREIILSECLPNSVRGMEYFVPYLVFSFGMVTAHLLLNSYFYNNDYLANIIYTGFILFLIPVLLPIYLVVILHNVYTSLIAGAQLYLEFYSALLFTILRISLTIGISLIPITILLFQIKYFGILILLVILPLILIMQAFAISVAAEDGTSVIERYRRIESDEEFNRRIDKETDPYWHEP